MSGNVYTKRVVQLEQILSTKLAELRIVESENRVLKQREAALQSCILGIEGSVAATKSILAVDAEGCSVHSCTSGSASCDSAARWPSPALESPQSSQHSGSKRGAQAVLDALEAKEQQVQNMLQQLCSSNDYNELYSTRLLRRATSDPDRAASILAMGRTARREYLVQAVHRMGLLLQKYGSNAPSTSSRSPKEQLHELIDELSERILTAGLLDPPQKKLGNMLINLETMQYEPYPAGYWTHVASSLNLSDDQKATLKLCWTRVKADKSALTAQHEQLSTRLAELHEQQQPSSEQYDQQVQQLPALQLPYAVKQQRHLKQLKIQQQQQQQTPLLQYVQQALPPKLQQQCQLQVPGQQQPLPPSQVAHFHVQYPREEHQMQAVELMLFGNMAGAAADAQWNDTSLCLQGDVTQQLQRQLQANLLLQQVGQQYTPDSALSVQDGPQQDVIPLQLPQQQQQQQQQEGSSWSTQCQQEQLQQAAAELLYQQLLSDVEQAHETSIGQVGNYQQQQRQQRWLPSQQQQQQEQLQYIGAALQQQAVLQMLQQPMQMAPEQQQQQQGTAVGKQEDPSPMESHRAKRQSPSHTPQQHPGYHTAGSAAADPGQQQYPCSDSTPAGSTPDAIVAAAAAARGQLRHASTEAMSPALSGAASGDAAAQAAKSERFTKDQYSTRVTYPRPEESIMQVHSKEQQQIEQQLHIVTEKIKMQHFCQSLQFHNVLTRRQIAEIYVNSWPYVPDALSLCEALDELGW